MPYQERQIYDQQGPAEWVDEAGFTVLQAEPSRSVFKPIMLMVGVVMAAVSLALLFAELHASG